MMNKTGGWKTRSGVCGVRARFVYVCVRVCVCVRACVRVAESRRRSPSSFTHPPLHAAPAPPAPPPPPPPLHDRRADERYR